MLCCACSRLIPYLPLYTFGAYILNTASISWLVSLWPASLRPACCNMRPASCVHALLRLKERRRFILEITCRRAFPCAGLCCHAEFFLLIFMLRSCSYRGFITSRKHTDNCIEHRYFHLLLTCIHKNTYSLCILLLSSHNTIFLPSCFIPSNSYFVAALSF